VTAFLRKIANVVTMRNRITMLAKRLTFTAITAYQRNIANSTGERKRFRMLGNPSQLQQLTHDSWQTP